MLKLTSTRCRWLREVVCWMARGCTRSAAFARNRRRDDPTSARLAFTWQFKAATGDKPASKR